MVGGARKILLAGVAVLAAQVLAWHPGRAMAGQACVDVALVLAVDTSGSVSPGEYHLQRDGIASAFRDPAVIAAMSQAGRVAVSVVFWGSEREPKPQSDWVVVAQGEGAERFARLVEAAPRRVSGDTGLGAGLMAALDKLAAFDGCAVRKIVNVSGDGEETRALRGQRRMVLPPEVRDMAEAIDVEVNALAIESDEANLAQYFRANVITGPDAFVMEARGYRDFAAALRRKLIREISPRVVAELPAALAPGAAAR